MRVHRSIKVSTTNLLLALRRIDASAWVSRWSILSTSPGASPLRDSSIASRIAVVSPSGVAPVSNISKARSTSARPFMNSTKSAPAATNDSTTGKTFPVERVATMRRTSA